MVGAFPWNNSVDFIQRPTPNGPPTLRLLCLLPLKIAYGPRHFWIEWSVVLPVTRVSQSPLLDFSAATRSIQGDLLLTLNLKETCPGMRSFASRVANVDEDVKGLSEEHIDSSPLTLLTSKWRYNVFREKKLRDGARNSSGLKADPRPLTNRSACINLSALCQNVSGVKRFARRGKHRHVHPLFLRLSLTVVLPWEAAQLWSLGSPHGASRDYIRYCFRRYGRGNAKSMNCTSGGTTNGLNELFKGR